MSPARVPPRWRLAVVLLPLVVSGALGVWVWRASRAASSSPSFCYRATTVFLDVTRGGSAQDLLHDPPALADRLRGLDAAGIAAVVPARLQRQAEVFRRRLPQFVVALDHLPPHASVVGAATPDLLGAFVDLGKEYQARCT